jgi:hypothetical protein
VTTPFAAMLIFVQTLLVLGVVALLEQHPLPVHEAAEIVNANRTSATQAAKIEDGG